MKGNRGTRDGELGIVVNVIRKGKKFTYVAT